jgi:hypothetical protein
MRAATVTLAALLSFTGPALALTRAPVPGATDPTVTQGTVHETVCRLGHTSTVRPPKEWSQALKATLLAEQGLPGRAQDYELEHLIPLGLGGAPRDRTNLWLQRWDEARAKDDDELELFHEVCSGRMTLDEARRRILDKWGPRL